MFLNEVFIHVFEVINFVSTVFIMFALPLRTLNICVFDHPVFFFAEFLGLFASYLV